MEDSSESVAQRCESPRIHMLQERLQAIKSSEEVNIRYMNAWEERELDRQDARAEGIIEGYNRKLREQVERKLAKGKSPEMIAEELDEPLDNVKQAIQALESR